MCLGYTAVDVVIVIVFQRAALEPAASSAVLLAPQRQYLLSSSAFPPSALPPPSLATSLPWLTGVRLLFLRNTCTLYSPVLFFLSFSEAGSKHNNTMQCIVTHFYTQVSVYTQICLSLSFLFSKHWPINESHHHTHINTDTLLFYLYLFQRIVASQANRFSLSHISCHWSNQLVCTVFDLPAIWLNWAVLDPQPLTTSAVCWDHREFQHHAHKATASVQSVAWIH